MRPLSSSGRGRTGKYPKKIWEDEWKRITCYLKDINASLNIERL